MEGKHFEELIKQVGAGVGRRHVLGGLIGATAALLTGAVAIKAKPGGNGKGRGQPKLSYCHQTGNGSYRFVTVGAPSAHKKHEGDIPCIAPAESGGCLVATGCGDATTLGTCTFEPVPDETPCDIDPLVEEECIAGACVPVTP